MSIQKQDVSEVMAPSTLGKSAEINAMIKRTPIDPLNASLSAIVGNKSSGLSVGKLACAAYKINMVTQSHKRGTPYRKNLLM